METLIPVGPRKRYCIQQIRYVMMGHEMGIHLSPTIISEKIN